MKIENFINYSTLSLKLDNILSIVIKQKEILNFESVKSKYSEILNETKNIINKIEESKKNKKFYQSSELKKLLKDTIVLNIEYTNEFLHTSKLIEYILEIDSKKYTMIDSLHEDIKDFKFKENNKLFYSIAFGLISSKPLAWQKEQLKPVFILIVKENLYSEDNLLNEIDEDNKNMLIIIRNIINI